MFHFRSPSPFTWLTSLLTILVHCTWGFLSHGIPENSFRQPSKTCHCIDRPPFPPLGGAVNGEEVANWWLVVVRMMFARHQLKSLAPQCVRIQDTVLSLIDYALRQHPQQRLQSYRPVLVFLEGGGGITLQKPLKDFFPSAYLVLWGSRLFLYNHRGGSCSLVRI